MFNLGSTKNPYTINYIKGGTSEKGEYTFITITDKKTPKNPYPEKCKINIWGKDLEKSLNLKQGDNIIVQNIKSFGNVSSQDRNDKSKWYKNLTVVCDAGDIIKGIPTENIDLLSGLDNEINAVEPIQDDLLPF